MLVQIDIKIVRGREGGVDFLGGACSRSLRYGETHCENKREEKRKFYFSHLRR